MKRFHPATSLFTLALTVLLLAPALFADAVPPAAGQAFPGKSANPDVAAVFDAILHRRAGNLQSLLEKNPILANSQDSVGQTPLLWSIILDNKEAASVLLANDADADGADQHGKTPLHEAVSRNSRGIADLLLQHGAHDRTTPLFNLIAQGETGAVAVLLRQQPALVNAGSMDDLPIIAPATSGATGQDMENRVVRPPRVTVNFFPEMTPLGAAIYWKRKDVVQLLVKQGANLKALNRVGEMPLHQAIKTCDVELAAFLLDAGADPNAPTQPGLLLRPFTSVTPMQVAAAYCGRDMLALLADHGANVNVRTVPDFNQVNDRVFGGTPLQIEIMRHNAEATLFLIEKGADISGVNSQGLTNLQQAARWGQKDVVAALLARGAAINERNAKGETALVLALKWYGSWNGNHDGVADLLIWRGADVNIPDEAGQTPLFHAVRENITWIVQLLLDKGADVNVTDKAGRNALRGNLQDQSSKAHLDIVSLLQQHGAKPDNGSALFEAVGRNDAARVTALLQADPGIVNARNDSMGTPLDEAVQNHNAKLAALLIAHGADVNARMDLGYTPLHSAAAVDMAALLLQNKANLEATNDAGATPLHWAVRSGRADLVAFLLNQGANVKARDTQQKTPLHCAAAWAGPVKILDLLIDKGADVKARDWADWTPLHHAAYEGRADAVVLLLKCGADPNAKDDQGWTPLHWAMQREHNDIVALLREHGGQ